MCLCLSDECDPQSMILLGGHGKNNIYNDNNYTSSLKRFQQRNGSTSVSLLNKHFFSLKSNTRMRYFRSNPCVAADTEERTQFAFNGYSPKWRYGDAKRHTVEKKQHVCIQKVFSSLHKIQIEPLMADGLF